MKKKMLLNQKINKENVQYEWVAENGACETCQSMDGEIYDSANDSDYSACDKSAVSSQVTGSLGYASTPPYRKSAPIDLTRIVSVILRLLMSKNLRPMTSKNSRGQLKK